MIWRWDQGRAQYFQFDAIKKIASILVQYNGADMRIVNTGFRNDLMSKTGLPFAPQHYTIKRNYKRVFECSLLASYIGQRLIVTDICRGVAENWAGFSTVDLYLLEVERRFRYPFPAFQNYSDVKGVCFPFLAMLKLLFAKALKSGDRTANITLDDVGAFLIANNATGLEDIDYYWEIEPQEYSFDSYNSSDQRRQVREMMAFIGQHSYLDYSDSTLRLNGPSLEECESVFNRIQPYSTEVERSSAVDDFLKLAAVTDMRARVPNASFDETEEELEEFTVQEGKKVFACHFSLERNAALRKAYLSKNPEPICDICGCDTHVMYPWTANMLEVHHIRPLASYNDEHTTSIDDVVGLCPTCHRAVHLYYRGYLKDAGKQDFETEDEALLLYQKAKSEVVIR